MVSTIPQTNAWDKYGRGASPKKALLFETLVNVPKVGKEIMDNLIANEIYPVSADFIGENYKGSGSYYDSGPYIGKILLNSNVDPVELRDEVIPHELRHRQSGNMGGVLPTDTDFDKRLSSFILSHENKSRLPQEMLAYGGDKVLLNPRKYYIAEDFKRLLRRHNLGSEDN